MEDRKPLKRKLSDRSKDSGRDNRLHVKNPYHNNSPDFAALALEFPHLLGDYVQINPVSKKGSIDFSNNNALRGLSKALLLKDFHVNVDIPENHLCPPLPNRINYLCWISDLLENSSAEMTSTVPTVLDIGVGPVCIFPILGNKLFGWKFVGSDVDSASINMCQRNIDANPELKEHIRAALVPDSNRLQEIIGKEYSPRLMLQNVGENNNTHSDDQTTPVSVDLRSIRTGHTKDNNLTLNAVFRGPVSSALFAMGGYHAQILLQCEKNIGTNSNENENGLAQTGEHNNDRLLTVVVCNPPFYDTDEQIQINERTVCTGSTSEMRTLGGEVAFISAIIYDSLLLKDRVLWYTSMVGKHSSLQPLKRLLSASGVPLSHYFVTTLSQGVTSRWVLAWTFSDDAARGYRKWCSTAKIGAAAVVAEESSTIGMVNDSEQGVAVTRNKSSSSNMKSKVCLSNDAGTSDCTSVDGVSLQEPERVRHFLFELAMPNRGMFKTMLPSDRNILTTGKYLLFFAIKEGVGSGHEPTAAHDNVDTQPAQRHAGAITIQGVTLNAVCRLVMAVEDTNRALANDKDALFYQFVGAAERKADESNGFGGDCIALLFHAMSYDAVPLKAYETLLSVGVTGLDGQRTTTATDSSINSADLLIKTVCCVQNVTNACENWSAFASKFHDVMVGNLWRTNRRWRRRLEAVGVK